MHKAVMGSLGLAVAAMLAACAQPGGETPAAAAVAPAAAPGPAGTRFDGRYTGVADQTFSRSRDCGPLQINQALMVRDGNARYVIDRSRNIIALGPVQADGSVRMTSDAGGNNTVTGKIEGGTFTGEFRSTGCGRSISLKKPAG